MKILSVLLGITLNLTSLKAATTLPAHALCRVTTQHIDGSGAITVRPHPVDASLKERQSFEIQRPLNKIPTDHGELFYKSHLQLRLLFDTQLILGIEFRPHKNPQERHLDEFSLSARLQRVTSAQNVQVLALNQQVAHPHPRYTSPQPLTTEASPWVYEIAVDLKNTQHYSNILTHQSEHLQDSQMEIDRALSKHLQQPVVEFLREEYIRVFVSCSLR